MEIRVVNTFLNVAEIGNITKTAEKLGYSQSAVTTQIQQLEAELGVALFDRVGRNIVLTDAGREFMPYAARLISAHEDAASFSLNKEEPHGALLIDATSTAAEYILAGAVYEFHELYPGIAVTVRTSEDIDIMTSRIRQNLSDFSFFLSTRDTYDGCEVIAERKEPFVFVASANDPIVSRKKVPLKDIFKGNFVSSFNSTDRDATLHRILEPLLLERGIELDPCIAFGTSGAITQYLLNGKCRTFLPEIAVLDQIEYGTIDYIRTDMIDTGIWSRCIRSSSRWISPQMQVFEEFIRDKFADTF